MLREQIRELKKDKKESAQKKTPQFLPVQETFEEKITMSA